MAKLLATDCFLDGTGTNSTTLSLDGLQQALDSGSLYGTYGGIDRSDIVADGTNNQGINGYVATLTPFTMAGMQTAYGSSWFGNEHVDLIVSTQSVWDIIWNKLQPQQRFMEESTDVAKIGFQSLRWLGASITVDQYCPAATIFGINSKYVYLYISTLPKYQFGQDEAHAASDCRMNGGEVGGTCDGNPEPSRDDKSWACVETMGHPLVRDEEIVQATANKEAVEELFTGLKEALETGSPIAEEELPLAA
jgi:hypothetical protein